MIRADQRQCYWNINFVPALKEGQVVSYRYRQKTLPGAFARSLQEMRAHNLEYEFFSNHVTYPTEKLQIRVTFAPEITPRRIGYDVWLGSGRTRHMGEYARVQTDRDFESNRDADNKVYGQLQVAYPIQGLRYVITWVPENCLAAGGGK